MEKSKIAIEVAYAKAEMQHISTVILETGCTIAQAIEQSSILTLFPEIDLTRQKVGIFGKISELSDVVKEGDRIAIYRPLVIDPKEVRRAKAYSKIIRAL